MIVAKERWTPPKFIEICGNIAGIGLALEVNIFTKKFCKNKDTPIVVMSKEILEEFLRGL